MGVHIRTMKESDRSAFRSFLGDGKAVKPIAFLFKAFERWNTEKPPMGIVKRLYTMPDGNDYRNFERLKKKIFEFEISSKRLSYFKSTDPNMYLSSNLTKEIIAAQLFNEQQANEMALQIMEGVYRKAIQSELTYHAKQGARYLYRFYGHIGQFKEKKQWHRTKLRLEKVHQVHQKISDDFEQEIFKPVCCPYHEQFHDLSPREEILIESAKLNLRHSRWINKYLKLLSDRNSSNPELAQRAFELRREINENPGVFPIHCTIAIYHLLLELLYDMGKISWLKNSTMAVMAVNKYMIHQSIPIVRFQLCFMLRVNNMKLLSLCLNRIQSIETYEGFTAFFSHAVVAECLFYLRTDRESEVLQRLNQGETGKNTCAINDFHMRTLEIIALVRTDKLVLVHDKLESLRKFIQRNEACQSEYGQSVYNLLKSGIQDSKKTRTKQSTTYFTKSFYDFGPFILEELAKTFPKIWQWSEQEGKLMKLYPADEEGKLKQVAEPKFRFGRS